MDNVYFKKLPSEVVPSVTNDDDVIICMTRGGRTLKSFHFKRGKNVS